MFGLGHHDIPEIDADEVFEAISAKKNVVLLDVRTPQELLRGKIIGSINVPLNEIEEKVELALPDKDKTIYVYCLSGSRSSVAVELMIKMGYKNVYSMTSGLLAWRAKNFPLTP